MPHALLNQLLTVSSRSGQEQAIATFLIDYAKARGYAVQTDPYHNVYLRKGKPGVVPCAAAHIDTVHPPTKLQVMHSDGRVFGIDEQGQRCGIGADDKAGVYVCLKLLEQVDDLIVILFAGEEISGIGARNASADWFKDVGYLLEFDSPSRDLVSYTSGGVRLFANDGEFIQTALPIMREQGLTQWQNHPFTDVMILRERFPISCLNLSSGFYNWHRPDEFIVIDEMLAAIDAAKALITALGCRAYPFPVGANDQTPPLFPVTGLAVPEAPKSNALDYTPPVKPLKTEPFKGDLTDSEEEDSFWQQYMPREVSFFKMALLDQLVRRPYHTFILPGPFNRKQLVADYQAQIYRSETGITPAGHEYLSRLLLCFGEGVFGYLEDEFLTVYGPTPEVAHAVGKNLLKYVLPRTSPDPHFFIVSLEDHGPEAQKIMIKRPAPVSAADLTLHYGDDFVAWEAKWLAKLNQTASGLTVLLGPPGCGKTSYLRALMSRLLNKAVFYFVPNDALEILTSPRFVNFWVRQTDQQGQCRKIAILEDAEELLLPRESGNKQHVSNLLNIADGFLGDHLKLHVLATTNVAMRELDPAIVRPGRLTGSREFRRLNRPEAERIAKAKGFELALNQPDYSLAEIYCGAADVPDLGSNRMVGFAP